MKINLNKYILIGILLLCSCKFAIPRDEQKMDKVIRETLYEINKNDYLSVINKLGSEYMRSDTSRIKYDVNYLYYLLVEYFDNDIKQLKWNTDGTIDNLGRLKYTIPLFNGFDSLTGIKHAALNLYLGPSEIIPLDKLSGFEPHIEVDVKYRGELRKAGKLIDIEEVVKSLGEDEYFSR